MTKLSLRDLPLKGKHVLMRVDFNVPMNQNGTISDDSRIKATIPSIQYILDQGGSVILMSHLGRPNGKVDATLSLAPCAKRLSELLGCQVQFAPDCIGASVQAMAASLKPKEVLLLENLRFHRGEESPEQDPLFVEQLAKLGDLYVNDAFGTAHRAHASTALIAKFFPGKAAAGFLMEKEIQALSRLMENPTPPFYALIGGSKISTKIGLIENLLKSVDALFLGGAMAFTFLKAQGIEIGDSLVELDRLDTAKAILTSTKKIHLPIDFVIANRCSNDADIRVISAKEGIPPDWRGLDIGPATVKEWAAKLCAAATVFWNGPLGVFELSHFAEGTRGIATALASSKGQVIVGGGDSVAAIEQAGLSNRFYHLSTGGGASLEFLEYGHLPGIDALSD